MSYYPPVKGQVHRFRDSVCLYVGTGETVYVSAADARKIARALNKAAKSCTSEPFAQSSGLTFSFSFQDGREKDLSR